MTSSSPLKLKRSPAGENPQGDAGPAKGAWKILIVDDETEVHSVTKLALNGYRFAGKGLQFLDAHSGAEARDILAAHDDIALVLLDVVMETDHAGLDVVGYIRETLGNRLTRIVLRTGQPGQAPEKRVIIDFDINDYKEKTELTAQKLFTLMSASLRSYRDMVALEDSRQGLKKIIDASANIFTQTSMQKFAEGALEQLLSLLRVKKGDAFYGRRIDAMAALRKDSRVEILAGTGKYARAERQASQGGMPGTIMSGTIMPGTIPDTMPDIMDELPAEIDGLLEKAADRNIILDRQILSYHKGSSGHENFLYVGGDVDMETVDRDMIELYARNVGLAFENVDLHRQIEETQREVVYRLAEAVETRSMETGNHLKRVAAMCKLLALEYGLSEDEAEILMYASPLHDVGKIAIPDAILNKPGKLDAAEWEVMKTHAELGHRMLASSDKPILKAGAIIALEHHEKWDGTGYPNGKAGEDIHIYGRIVAIADVYDALASKRCYKDAWALGDIYTFVKSEKGRHFDPDIVDALTRNLDYVQQIMVDYSDGENGFFGDPRVRPL